ncbi:hypothetical protein BKN38_07770 [Helicobacter sp. CLO-3]|nr:hypothetical protein BA723_08120 [Helicobacter sp. CLO-3]OHU82041.1 hypothetical protein BKN38_07770 [Helicobacter sp. CLO-3]
MQQKPESDFNFAHAKLSSIILARAKALAQATIAKHANQIRKHAKYNRQNSKQTLKYAPQSNMHK